MPETPDIVPEDPDIPDEYPSGADAEPEIRDQPMGPPPDADPDQAPLPGLPDDREPPDAG